MLPGKAAAVAYVALAAASARASDFDLPSSLKRLRLCAAQARQKGGKRKGWRQESEFTAPSPGRSKVL